jgi:polyisoprenoid-binding protein YceI
MIGDLTLHGVMREVTLRVGDIGPERRDSQGRVKMSARVSEKINRRDFGLTWGPLLEALALVGNKISLTIEVRLVKK